MIDTIIHNKMLMITITVWCITQAIKVVLGVIRERRFNFKWFVGTGGMPSSHAAGATALATAIGLQEGFASVGFTLAAVFAMVTMFDAQGVRRSAGQQAEMLNQLMEDMYQGKLETNRLFELIGHTPLQVLIGGILGIVFSIFLFNRW